MGDAWRGLLKGAVGPKDNDSRYLLDVHSRDLPGEKTMRRYGDDDEVDMVIVGAGAGGSVLAQRLARAGWACWTLGLPLAAAGLLSGSLLLCRLAGLAAGLGLAAFLVNVARIAAHWRAPTSVGTQRALRSPGTGAPEKGPVS